MARHKVSAAEKLRTLESYIALQSTRSVAKTLGLSCKAVRNRLKGMGVACRPSRQSDVSVADANGGEAALQKLRDHWIEQAEIESKYAPGNGLVPAEAMYLTLKLYLEHENMGLVAREMGLTPPAVLYRLRRLGLPARPVGMRTAPLAEFNDMDELRQTLAQLEAEVLARQTARA